MLKIKTWSMALAALCLVLFTATTAFSQKAEWKKERAEKMKEELGLSEDQFAKMEALHDKHWAEMKALRTEGEAPDREQMKKVRENHRAELEKILSPEQLQKMDEMRPEHGPHGGKGFHGGKGGHHGMHGQWGSENHQKVQSLLLEQRAKLETKLSENDKAEIAALREDLQALRVLLKEKRQQVKDSHVKGEQHSPEMRAEMDPLREEKKAIIDKAMVIAARYQRDIQALHEEIKPQLDALRPAPEQRKACEKGGEKCKMGAEKGKHAGKEEMHSQRMAARFILMDPSQTVSEEAAELGIYPNPSQNANTLTFTTKSSGQVRVDLLSKDSQVIKTIFQGEKEAGTHAIPVEMGDMATDIYYYRVTAGNSVSTKRFTVVR